MDARPRDARDTRRQPGPRAPRARGGALGRLPVHRGRGLRRSLRTDPQCGRSAGQAACERRTHRWAGGVRAPRDPSSRGRQGPHGLREVFDAKLAPDAARQARSAVTALAERWWSRSWPLLKDRDEELPRCGVSSDFKASNLVFAERGPVLVDPDNGGVEPGPHRRPGLEPHRSSRQHRSRVLAGPVLRRRPATARQRHGGDAPPPRG